MAAGASIREENLEEFRVRFNEAVKKQLKHEQLIPTVKVDGEVRIAQLTPKFFNIIERMEPFGPKNMRPVFVAHGVKNNKNPRGVGKGGAHLKLNVVSDGVIMEGIGFGFGNRRKELIEAESFSVAFTLTENVYMGRKDLQMTVKGISVP